MVFFLKAVTGRVEINPTVTFRIHGSTRTTRHTSNLDITLFLIKHYKTTTFQRSFFNRTSRIWNALATDLGLSVACSLSSFKAVLYSYYKQVLIASYIPDDPRSFKSIFLTCNAAHNLGWNITDVCSFDIFSNLCLRRAVIGTRCCGVPVCSPVNICTLFFVVSLILLFGKVNKLTNKIKDGRMSRFQGFFLFYGEV